MTRLGLIAAAVAAGSLAACSGRGVQDLTATSPSSAVKFYNFALNAPSVNFFANDVKVTATNSTSGAESTAGTGYGSVAAGGFYTGIAPGAYTLSGRISATVDNGVPIASTPVTLADGKGYSYYLSGPYNAATKQSDAFIVEDAVPPIDYSQTFVRFVNAIYNANPLTLYAKNTVTGDSVAIGGAQAYKGASAFVAMPGAAYDLTARYTGSNTAVITRAGVSFSTGRSYTISARGDITVVSSSAATRPILDSTPNF